MSMSEVHEYDTPAHRSAERLRLYTPDSTLWRVHREGLLLLSGSRALLLEIAHPMIAAGVAQHSDFRRRPLRRLFNTVRVMQQLSFGGGQRVRRGLRHFHQCHHHVHGRLAESAGAYAAGTPYHANNPQLRLWVFATMIDSILVVYEMFVKGLTEDERTAYYEESKRMAQLLGIPENIMPETFTGFREYIQLTVSDGTLSIGETGRAICAALFEHPIIGPLARLASYLGIGLLPPSLRDAFGFGWTQRDQARLVRFASLTRRMRPFLPDILAVQPDAWLVERGFIRQV